ncbi:unnamed protein product [Effrenium voratum]|nr:unnamed protein product [Effrenium voratum]
MADTPVFWTLPPAGQALMVLGVLWLLSSRSWRLLLLLLALELSAHLNAGYNGPSPERPKTPAPTPAPLLPKPTPLRGEATHFSAEVVG